MIDANSRKSTRFIDLPSLPRPYSHYRLPCAAAVAQGTSHVCIDDASRVAFVQVMPDEKKQSATAFLKAAVAYYASLGVAVTRVMTDNSGTRRDRGKRRGSETTYK
jgi:hypothetical protein